MLAWRIHATFVQDETRRVSHEHKDVLTSILATILSFVRCTFVREVNIEIIINKLRNYNSKTKGRIWRPNLHCVAKGVDGDAYL